MSRTAFDSEELDQIRELARRFAQDRVVPGCKECEKAGRNGYLLPFENDQTVGKWVWLYRQKDPGYLDAYEAATASLTGTLVERLGVAWEDRHNYEALSAGAVASAHDRFHPDVARCRLETIYERLRLERLR